MPIPDYQTIMLPLLSFAADGKPHNITEAIQFIYEQFKLNDLDRKELLPSGRQPIIDNRVGWAKTYLAKAGLLISPRRGFFLITPLGLDILAKKPTKIDVKYLNQFPDFQEFRSLRRKKDEKEDAKINSTATPEELIELGFKQYQEKLYSDLMERLRHVDPKAFEKVMIDLLKAMGYGGFRPDAGTVTGRSGDEGIDGEIKEDKLGLDVIRIQAKRWGRVVGRPEVQTFIGALAGKKTKKGIFITTSGFTKEAIEYASSLDTRVILIDGMELTKLMVDYGVGVTDHFNYRMKKIDSDYFDEE